jgi:hypothetical protein
MNGMRKKENRTSRKRKIAGRIFCDLAKYGSIVLDLRVDLINFLI